MPVLHSVHSFVLLLWYSRTVNKDEINLRWTRELWFQPFSLCSFIVWLKPLPLALAWSKPSSFLPECLSKESLGNNPVDGPPSIKGTWAVNRCCVEWHVVLTCDIRVHVLTPWLCTHASCLHLTCAVFFFPLSWYDSFSSKCHSGRRSRKDCK